MNKIFVFALILSVAVGNCLAQSGKKSKCHSSPTIDAKVEKYIKSCQEEVKTNIIEDVLFAGTVEKYQEPELEYITENYSPRYQFGSEVLYPDEGRNPHPYQHERRYPTQTLKYEEFDLSPEEERRAALKWRRTKRATSTFKTRNDYQTSGVSKEDKFVAGCLMQCIYRKSKAVDIYGFPTLQGLVELYTDGINEQKFFVSTLKAVDSCLKRMSAKHNIVKGKAPEKGEVCELSFDVFDCVSDAITEYCDGN
jgi:hypothetical protein